MRHARIIAQLVPAVLLAASSFGFAQELPVIFREDFEDGADEWKVTDESRWHVVQLPDGNHVFELKGKSDYEPPHRSPTSIALRKDVLVGDFVLTAKVKTLQTARGHRDMCIFWGYQDPSHFYYVHFGQATDDAANQIFIVNAAPRTKITEVNNEEGTPWRDDTWHDVKVVRKVDEGLIEVYFDDMTKPQKVAHDKTFQLGQIGIGSFDDLGQWDDVELRGELVQR